MAYISDQVLDNGLSWLAGNATRLDICTQEPATYTEATSTYTCGSKAGVVVGAISGRSPSGRKVTVPAVSDGSVTATATAAYLAVSKPTETPALVASQALSLSQAVTSGNVWSTTAFDIGIPGAE